MVCCRKCQHNGWELKRFRKQSRLRHLQMHIYHLKMSKMIACKCFIYDSMHGQTAGYLFLRHPRMHHRTFWNSPPDTTQTHTMIIKKTSKLPEWNMDEEEFLNRTHPVAVHPHISIASHSDGKFNQNSNANLMPDIIVWMNSRHSRHMPWTTFAICIMISPYLLFISHVYNILFHKCMFRMV